MLSRLNDPQGCPLPKRSQLHGPSSSAEPACPLPSRVSLTAQATPAFPSRKVLAGAGVSVLALAVPLVGFASASPPEVEAEKTLGSFADSEQWGSGISAAASLSVESDLDAVPAASSRAKVRTPIEVSSCVEVDQSADGSRGITQRFSAVWPMQEGTYTQTSPFSWRVSPISGELLQHEGVDWAAPAGTPILAAAAGTVTEVSYNSRSGNFVEILHQLDDGSTFKSLYMHQLDGGIIVSVGQQVQAGQQIGAVGSTGWSTGAHLHFQIQNQADQPVEPIGWMQSLGATFVGQECS